jgi:hypothetical protein
MRRFLRVLAAALPVACTGQRPFAALRDSWLVLPDPVDSLSPVRLGAAYDFGNVNSGCFTFDSAMSRPAESWATKVMQSNVSQNDSFTLNFLGGLQVGASLSRASRIAIRFDSVVIAQSVNLRPLLNCDAAGQDLAPLRPAISALVGARGFVFAAWDSAGQAVNLTVPTTTATGGLRHVGSSGDSSVFSFGGLRWIGLHLTGFQVSQQASPYPRDTRVLTPTCMPAPAMNFCFDVVGAQIVVRTSWQTGGIVHSDSAFFSGGTGRWLRATEQVAYYMYVHGPYQDEQQQPYVVFNLRFIRLGQKHWTADRQRRAVARWVDARVNPVSARQ